MNPSLSKSNGVRRVAVGCGERPKATGAAHATVVPGETRSANHSPAHKKAAGAAWLKLFSLPAVRDQQIAFTCATGVPLTWLPASNAHPGGSDDAFCVKGCLGSPSGAFCSRKLIEAEHRAVRRGGPVQFGCPSGLVKILVPVIFGGNHIGSLLAGPFSLEKLDDLKQSDWAERLKKYGLGDRLKQLERTWRFCPLLSSVKCRAMGTLLQMFARYVEECWKEIARLESGKRSALVAKIEAYLAECQDTVISSKQAAARVSLSPCHFCAVFKKQTGLTFTQFRVRHQLERARSLLLSPDRRVSDAAYEAGFESISYFNRAFRRQFGCSPTEFRDRFTTENQVNKIEIQA